MIVDDVDGVAGGGGGGRPGWRWGPGAGLAEWGWAKRFDFGKGGGKVEGRGNALPQYLQYGKL